MTTFAKSEIISKTLRIARLCSRYLDLLAGLKAERQFIQELLQELDYPTFTFHLQPVTVLTFEDKYTVVEVEDKIFPACTMPYSRGGVHDGRLVDKIEKIQEGDVLIVDFPKDLDDAKFVLQDALKRGVGAVIFTDPENTIRRIVVSTRRDYTWSSSEPVPIPVVCVSKQTGEKLKKYIGKNVRVISEVTYRHSVGYNVEVTVQEGEPTILLSAHFDHWLTGLFDNALGVGVVATLIQGLVMFEQVLSQSRFGVKALFFTAEEFGIPNYASLYWAWGSKMYVNFLKSRDMLDDVYFVLNVDVVGKEPQIYATDDILTWLSETIPEGVKRLTIPYYDSQNFEMMGIPTVTISCIEKAWSIYHSLLEQERNIELDSIVTAHDIALTIFRKVLLQDFDYSIYIEQVRKELEQFNLYRRFSNDLQTYRKLRCVLSKFVVEYRVDEINLKYVRNVLTYLKSVCDDVKVLQVQELGTGTDLYVKSSPDVTYGQLLYLQDVVRYELWR